MRGKPEGMWCAPRIEYAGVRYFYAERQPQEPLKWSKLDEWHWETMREFMDRAGEHWPKH